MLFALAVLAAPWIILLAGRRRRTSATPLLPPRPLVPRNGTGPLAGASGSSSAWPLLAGIVLAAAAVVVVAVLADREPREAIIACYAAMERGFAAAGSAPEAADTPAEVLARASDAGLIRSDSAAVLTGLFRRPGTARSR